MKTKINTLFFLISMIALSAATLFLIYQVDNKYTFHTSQTRQSVADNPVVFLIDGWELYRDQLLSPADFTRPDAPKADEIVWIGQYGGFEGADYTRNPHGKATYRRMLSLPAAPASYTLELPEIYSAYRLYIAGMPVEQLGDPDELSYQAETGNITVTFFAAGDVEILIAAADYSYLYSGMVYPPAFGVTKAVLAMVNTRLILRTIICGVGITLAFLCVVAWFLMKRKGHDMVVLFGLICVCFVGYTCYPVLKTLCRGGMLWYALENFCYCGMLLLVGLLQMKLYGSGVRFAGGFFLFGSLVCVTSVLYVLIPVNHMVLLGLYSAAITLFKWVTALFITLNAVSRAGRNSAHERVILGGIVFFDSALLMDRLLPLFEPVYLGWFVEIGGFAVVLTLGVAMCRETAGQYHRKLELERQVTNMESLLELERLYVADALKDMDEVKVARHDLRHHLSVISGLAAEKKNDKLIMYLENYKNNIESMPQLAYSNHEIIDMILRRFAAIARQGGIAFEVNVQIPAKLPFADTDPSAVLSNLLENAFEACIYVADHKKVKIQIKAAAASLIIAVENNFDGNICAKGSRLMSRKKDARVGKGLGAVQLIAEKYGGTFEFSFEETLFRTMVLLPAVNNLL